MSFNGGFQIDTLESRRLMANVAVQLGSGLLQIAAGGANDALTLSISGDNLLVKAGAGTTVNGAAAASFPKFSVTGISAALGSGNDSITLDGVDQGLGGTLDAGGGNDVINLKRTRLHGMLLLGGSGGDFVNLYASTLQSVIFDTGSGNDLVSVFDNTVFNFTSVVMGDGNDAFVAVKNTVFGFTSVDGGAGFDVAIGFQNNLPGGSFVTDFELRWGV